MNPKRLLAIVLAIDLILGGLLAGILGFRSVSARNALPKKAPARELTNVRGTPGPASALSPNDSVSADSLKTTNDFDWQWAKTEDSSQ